MFQNVYKREFTASNNVYFNYTKKTGNFIFIK